MSYIYASAILAILCASIEAAEAEALTLKPGRDTRAEKRRDWRRGGKVWDNRSERGNGDSDCRRNITRMGKSSRAGMREKASWWNLSPEGTDADWLPREKSNTLSHDVVRMFLRGNLSPNLLHEYVKGDWVPELVSRSYSVGFREALQNMIHKGNLKECKAGYYPSAFNSY